jgi:hypothetical protein
MANVRCHVVNHRCILGCCNIFMNRFLLLLTTYDGASNPGRDSNYNVQQRVLSRYVFFFIWFVRLLALRPLLAYCASLG